MMKLIMSNRVAQVVIAAATGVIIGFLVFAISQVTGRNLYIILGGLAGAALALLLQRYWRRVQLTEVKITIPQMSELTFVVNNDARQVAWELYVEIATRVSTQPLADEGGFIREALTSLYGLFAMTRDVLKDSRPSMPVSGEPAVEHLAVIMLNHQLRPFLSKWHPLLSVYEKKHPDDPESDWQYNTACRDELRVVQKNLMEFVLGFAKLAGVSDAESTIRPANVP